ncbi:uncharacterized protein BYT42DRAFT_54716 [Radiomyces spectabilis]|uniref:uncharacterized protein n=1 Tax=Radiomyces spectabilis TaxID=64574 RepID=UPI002221230E|nr:uncharacterized protein BYT42DRAFT_54716 [Radiomyces spectabilis]KAI8372998.1 hypothetical protein BYT42DRAFT_54716 [Radiomyces spectabilis]
MEGPALDAVLSHEANNRRAPESYQKFFAKLLNEVRPLREQAESWHKAQQQLEAERNAFAKDIDVAHQNYDELMLLCNDEHAKCVELERKLEALEQKLSGSAISSQSSVSSQMSSSSLSSLSSQPEDAKTLSKALAQEKLRRMEAEQKVATLDKARESDHQQMMRLATSRKTIEASLMEQYKEMESMRAKIRDMELQAHQASMAHQAYLQAKDRQYAILYNETERLKAALGQVTSSAGPVHVSQPTTPTNPSASFHFSASRPSS